MSHHPDRPDPKLVDLPPYGPRNPDPLTNQPGSHPVETTIGAVIGGVASGVAVGAVGGPVGAIIGGIVGGAAAGGLAGKGIGELIDPTTEDNWLRGQGDGSAEAQAERRRAFRFGLAAQERHAGRSFAEVEPDLRREWAAAGEPAAWSAVYDAVRYGFDRTATHPALTE